MQVSEAGPTTMSGGRSARKKASFVHLRVTPENPRQLREKTVLLDYLDKMGCNGLLAVPWGVFDHPQLATELLAEPDERYAESLRSNRSIGGRSSGPTSTTLLQATSRK